MFYTTTVRKVLFALSILAMSGFFHQTLHAATPPTIGLSDSRTIEENLGGLIDSSATLSDDSSDLHGGYIRVTYQSGGGAEDNLSIAALAAPLSVGTVGSYQGIVYYADAPSSLKRIGTINSTDNGAGGNSLQVDFNTPRDITVDPAMAQLTLRALSYWTSSDTPTYSRTIRVRVNDGHDGTSNNEDVTITVNPNNDKPLVWYTGSKTFEENAVNEEYLTIDSTVDVFDPDGAYDFDGGYIKIEYWSGYGDEEDNLTVPAGTYGSLTVNAYGEIDYGGSYWGIVAEIDSTYDGQEGQDLLIHLYEEATPAAVEAILEHIAYKNTSDTPIEVRYTSISVHDGGEDDGGVGMNRHFAKFSQTLTINVTPQSEPPVIDMATEVDCTNNYDIDATVEVTDADSADFDGGILDMHFLDSEFESESWELMAYGPFAFGNTDEWGNCEFYYGEMVESTWIETLIGNYRDGYYDDFQGFVITFNSNATPQIAEEILENIRYYAENQRPSRIIRFILSDGEGGSTIHDVEINTTW